MVTSIISDKYSGLAVEITHGGLPLEGISNGAPYVTWYAHLAVTYVRAGDQVARGRRIGVYGKFRDSGEISHVHWMLCRGMCTFEATVDPLAYVVGCYSPDNSYRTDRLELTYPVNCTSH